MAGVRPQHKGWPRTPSNGAADASPCRLGAAYIDLYCTHYDDTSVPVEEIIGALDELVTAGKVRAIAASDITPER